MDPGVPIRADSLRGTEPGSNATIAFPDQAGTVVGEHLVVDWNEMEMQPEFRGGLAVPGKFRAGTPWILLVPTKEQLKFRARHGLGRFFGPWTLERDDVRLVYRTMRGLDTFHGLAFLRRDGTWWTFWTYHPNEVLDCLEELGYPMDPATRQGQGRFFAR